MYQHNIEQSKVVPYKPSQPAARRGRTQKRILIVEDEPVLAFEYARIMREAGMSVVGPTSSMLAALERIGDGGIDGAVLDVSLQGVLVIPVAAALAAHKIPFFFLSGLPRASVCPYQHIHFVVKPVTAARLLAAARLVFYPSEGSKGVDDGRPELPTGTSLT